MSSRKPRRQRRRPRERASTLPRPGAAAQATAAAPARIPEQTSPEHHVATDYRYVRRDLVAVAAVSVITLAFVLVMAVIA